MTTPADELRTAAAKLRAFLADPNLTPGPWLSMDRGDRLLWDGPGAEDQPPRYVVDEPMSNGANADYIAAMHPAVGKTLADWLDIAVGYAERWPPDAQTNSPFRQGALAVARAINGSSGGEQR